MHHFHHFKNSGKSSTKEIIANSPWGSLASLFLLQSYGFILLNGLFFTAAISFEFFWLLFWIIFMLIMQTAFIRKIKSFLNQQEIKDYLLILREPSELFRFFITLLAIFIFALFNIGYYPFPTTEKPLLIYLGVELAISIVLSFYFKDATEIKAQNDKKKTFLGLIILLIYTCVPLFQKFPPEIIYLTTIPGLGLILFLIAKLLMKKKSDNNIN